MRKKKEKKKDERRKYQDTVSTEKESKGNKNSEKDGKKERETKDEKISEGGVERRNNIRKEILLQPFFDVMNF
jgi:hypothetical protein